MQLSCWIFLTWINLDWRSRSSWNSRRGPWRGSSVWALRRKKRSSKRRSRRETSMKRRTWETLNWYILWLMTQRKLWRRWMSTSSTWSQPKDSGKNSTRDPTSRWNRRKRKMRSCRSSRKANRTIWGSQASLRMNKSWFLNNRTPIRGLKQMDFRIHRIVLRFLTKGQSQVSRSQSCTWRGRVRWRICLQTKRVMTPSITKKLTPRLKSVPTFQWSSPTSSISMSKLPSKSMDSTSLPRSSNLIPRMLGLLQGDLKYNWIPTTKRPSRGPTSQPSPTKTDPCLQSFSGTKAGISPRST